MNEILYQLLTNFGVYVDIYTETSSKNLQTGILSINRSKVRKKCVPLDSQMMIKLKYNIQSDTALRAFMFKENCVTLNNYIIYLNRKYQIKKVDDFGKGIIAVGVETVGIVVTQIHAHRAYSNLTFDQEVASEL